jgi:hypothetical protein
MINRDQWHRFLDHPAVEWAIFVTGVVLMILSPLAGVLPGPGGILLFALGLAMVLKTSMWAKRRYVRFKKSQPKAGRWIDWGLRRQSPKRREELRKVDGELEAGAIVPEPPQTPPETWADREGRSSSSGRID